jgi:hypothetical protein
MFFKPFVKEFTRNSNAKNFVEQNKTLKFNEDFLIEANLPFNKIDKNKISIYNKDSLKIEFEVKLDTIMNQYSFVFEKEVLTISK